MDASPRYRTVWISDVHLGTRDSKAASIVDFLQHHPAERYYLVGDIVDGWSLARSWYWPEAHNRVIEMLLQCARNAEVIYIPGNHDEAARRFPGLRFGGITTQMNHIHTTADGRRFLVLHGDEFDGMIRHAPWLSHGGDIAYQALLTMNRYVNRVRRWMNLPYWSFSQYVKQRTKKAVQFIANFETVVARRAAKENVDGVICGHIHHPVIRKIGSVHYVNTGDWIESCTGVVEHMDGTLELRRWLPGRTDVGPHALSAESTADPTASDAATHEGDALPGAAMAAPRGASWSPSSE